jgi:pimeloyl-ACP methyl ester carboxylesterase
MDLGGIGTPLIVIQGAHNYFDESSTNQFIQYSNDSWKNFFSTFTKNYHVLAPLKRGFGKTDAQLEIENVRSSTLDLISFLDKMEFEKAFFIGRDISAQTMLDLAENYPERIQGLVFIDPTFVFTDVQDKVTKDFIFFSYSDSYNQSEYENYKMKETHLYRPEIFIDSSKNINVPALLFYHSLYSNGTLALGRIERFIRWVETEDNIGWDKEYSSIEIANYFEDLSIDKERMTAIRDYLQKNNPSPQMNERIRKAFGDNLVIFNETNIKIEDIKEALMNVYNPVVNAFLYMSN